MPAAPPKHFLQISDFTARRVRAPDRAHPLDQGPIQALRALPAAARPHARDGVREGVDAHPRVVRSGHESAGRHRDQPESHGHAPVPRRADRGRRARDLADGRRGDDPHVRAVDHRAVRRAFARAGDQRPHQRIPSVPDPGRHLHVHRAPRLDPRAHHRLDRRLQQRLLHVAAGRVDLRLRASRLHAAGLRDEAGRRRRGGRGPLPDVRRSEGRVPRRRSRHDRRVDEHGLRGRERRAAARFRAMACRRRHDAPGRSPTPSSCTACRRIAARKSPPM